MPLACVAASSRQQRSHICASDMPSRCSKPDHHIGHLHAGVVDVVLHIDLLPRRAQQAHKRVAQNGVAQMPDVRRLVGIDAGVLDQRVHRPAAETLASILRRLAIAVSTLAPRSSRALIYPAPATSKPANPSTCAQRRHNLLRNHLRRLAQLARQLERNRRRELAKLQVRRQSPAECSRAVSVVLLLRSTARSCCSSSRVLAVPDTRTKCLRNP